MCAQKRYFRLIDKKTVTYDGWIRQKEAAVMEKAGEIPVSGQEVRRLPFSAAAEYVCGNELLKETAEIVLFMAENGEESQLAEPLLTSLFRNSPGMDMAYGDEDVISPEGVRYTPWFKPDWSPDTFLSCFYFGSVFAVRVKALLRLTDREKEEIRVHPGEEERIGLYRLCFRIAAAGGGFLKRADGDRGAPVGHLDEILYHSHTNTEMGVLYNRDYIFQCMRSDGEGNNDCYLTGLQKEAVRFRTKGPQVSVIIPSKDNADVLERCVTSVKRSAEIPCEIIVVDNGSKGEIRERLVTWCEKENVRYLYEKMPFNFSEMCNRGAAAAKGQVYLFLNDDVEAPESIHGDWIAGLYERAVQPWTGAVGMKLLYPSSKRIQHAGIANLRLGPVHKLQFLEDEVPYYYGWNRGKRNVLAVTGACLAVEADKFKEVSGFPEELAVAFNDVDFCFSLYEKGYYNVVFQDAYLYHHESWSRGRDEEEEQLSRLLAEKRKLYDRHRGLYGYDPFYHKYLAKDILSTGFDTGADYEWQEDGAALLAEKKTGTTENAREDGCVLISLEYAGTLAEWNGYSAFSGNYYIQGYCFVAGDDNACYEKKLLLTDNGKEYVVRPTERIRKDVERNLPDQVNVGLAGFDAVIDKDSLEPGDYRIGLLVSDRRSGNSLYHMTNRYLHCG